MANLLRHARNFSEARVLELGSRINARFSVFQLITAPGEQREWWHASRTVLDLDEWYTFGGVKGAGRVPAGYPRRVVLGTELGKLAQFAAEHEGYMAGAYIIGETATMATLLDPTEAGIRVVSASFGVGRGPLSAQLGAYVPAEREFIPFEYTRQTLPEPLPDSVVRANYPHAEHL